MNMSNHPTFCPRCTSCSSNPGAVCSRCTICSFFHDKVCSSIPDAVCLRRCAACSGDIHCILHCLPWVAGVDGNTTLIRSTALPLDASSDFSFVIKMLLQRRGQRDINSQDKEGNSVLHLVGPLAIKHVLNTGVDPNVTNKDGKTALSKCLQEEKLTVRDIRLFIEKGAFLESCDYVYITKNLFLINNLLKDVKFCTQSIVNKFHHQSLPALKRITNFSRRLPSVDNFKLKDKDVKDVEHWVKSEIERHIFCNVVKVHPISLSALCVLSLIACQSGMKRSASPDFVHSPLKKKS